MPLFSLITPFITPKKEEDNILLMSSILICQTTTIFFIKIKEQKRKEELSLIINLKVLALTADPTIQDTVSNQQYESGP